MPPPFRIPNDPVGRDRARAGGMSLDPWLHIAEARRVRSEVMAEGVRWIWTNLRRVMPTRSTAASGGIPAGTCAALL